MEEGVFVRWLKPAGASVQVGEALFELEGEKAVQEIEALEAGVLHVLQDGPGEGSTVPVGALLGFVLSPGEAPPQSQDSVSMSSVTERPAGLPPVAPSVRRLARQLGVDLSQVTGSGESGRIMAADINAACEMRQADVDISAHASGERRQKASPRARRAARSLGINWRTVAGTGRSGRVRERDILQAKSGSVSGASPAAPEGPSLRRKTIAQRMLTSQQRTAAVTLTSRADATELVRLRGELKSRPGIVPAITDLIGKLTEVALRQHPLLAATWNEDGVVLPDLTKLSIGVAVDTEQGLLVGVVRDVAQKSLSQFAEQSRQMAQAARNGKLAARDMEGASLTITNLGSYGIDAFTPIIPIPQAAILGLGAIRRKPVVVDEDKIAIRSIITLSLTFDHRVVDGAPAARFLQSLVGLIESVTASQVGA
jgi:pyruvate dehydrogenase E2 component (dihydrolipoamide acetyltransferase)